MYRVRLSAWGARLGWMLLGVGLLLGGCGLVGGHGNLAKGDRYQAAGEYRAAYIEAKKVLQHDSKNGDAWLLLGKASLMLGNPKDAVSELQNAQKHGVPIASWAVPMGRALLVAAKYDEILKTLPADGTFEPAVKARVDILRGNALLGLKQTAKAGQAFEAALALEPKAPRAMVGLAKLAQVAENTDSARNYIRQAIAASPDNPQAWVVKGDLAFDAGNFPDAEVAYQKVLDFKKADWLPQERFYTLARLADSQARQDQFGKALANIQTLQKMAPAQPYPHYLQAVVLYKQGHLDDAVTQLQQVLKASPNNVPAQLLMGAVNYAQGNYGPAQMYLSNVMGIDPHSLGARRLLALTYYREGRSDQALAMLRPTMPGKASDAELVALLQKAVAEGVATPKGIAKAAAENPAARAPNGATGAAPGTAGNPAFAGVDKALASGNMAEAIQLLKAMPAGDAATEAQRASMLVMAYVHEKHPGDAVKAAAAYAAKKPHDTSAHVLYGTALIADGKRAAARAQYLEASKLDPNDLSALMNLASLDVLEGHDAQAVDGYQAVLKKDARNAPALTALAQLAERKGDKAEAIQRYQQAIKAAPKAGAAYVGLVMLYSRAGQFDQAAATAEKLADADPHNPAALNALGAAELNAGHASQALAPLQKAVQLAPKESLYRTNLARAQLLNKDAKGAEGNLEQVVKADPTQVQAASLLALLKLQDHDLPGALALAHSLQKQPSTKVVGLTLEGDLYMADKSYAKAAQAYQQGLKAHYDQRLVVKEFLALNAGGAKQPDGVLRDWLAKHPDDAATRLLLAQYYMDHGHNAPAAGQYEQVLKAHPSNIDALNNLAWIYAGQHNPKAVTLAEKAHQLAPTSPGILDTYGWALVSANRPKAALPILTQAAKAAPKALTIQYHLAVAQAGTGDKAGARATLAGLQKPDAVFPEKQAAEKLYQTLGGTAK